MSIWLTSFYKDTGPVPIMIIPEIAADILGAENSELILSRFPLPYGDSLMRESC